MQDLDSSERINIIKLKNELNESSGSKSKVEWLYSGDRVDRDAYLLGKPIDKLLIEKELDKPKEIDFSSTVDLANKIREDPLFEIKKKEFEAKKKLIENPYRVKQLQKQLSMGHDNNNSNGDEESRRRRRSPASSSDDERSRSRKKHHHHKEEKKKHRKNSRSRDEREEPHHHHHHRPGYGLQQTSRQRSPSPPSSNSKTRQEVDEYKKRIDDLKKLREKKKSAPVEAHRHHHHHKKQSLTDEERERRLREMQDNAKWREDQRSSNIKQYKRDDDREESATAKGSHDDAKHIFNSMLKSAYSSTEDRIKRNMNKVQRSDGAYDQSFARK